MYIGRHYLKSKKWIPAINRFKNVLENYQTTVYVEETIHRLVETYYIIGLESEAKKYAKLLGYNYQSSGGTKHHIKFSIKIMNFQLKNLNKLNKKITSLFKRFVGKFKRLFN